MPSIQGSAPKAVWAELADFPENFEQRKKAYFQTRHCSTVSPGHSWNMQDNTDAKMSTNYPTPSPNTYMPNL